MLPVFRFLVIRVLFAYTSTAVAGPVPLTKLRTESDAEGGVDHAGVAIADTCMKTRAAMNMMKRLRERTCCIPAPGNVGSDDLSLAGRWCPK